MKRPSEMNVLWTFVACLLTTVRTRSVAYMDLQTRSANFTGCGDTIEDTISGQVFSSIPSKSPDLNCSLTLFSPPGTRLSLTVNEVDLSKSDAYTCVGGNRLEILGSNTEGAMSLLPSFPHGLCGNLKPSQPIETTDNQLFLTLRSVQSAADSSFSLSYTAFKTKPDESCYQCKGVSGTRNTQFCIDQSLVCDGEQNCPAAPLYSEENEPRCSVSTPSPTNSPGISITVIVIVVILMVVLLAIIIFTILALMAKRVHSKRVRNSVRRPQRASQSRPGNSARGGPPRQQRRPSPDSRNPGRVSTGAPTFTTEGEYADFDFPARSVGGYQSDVPPTVVSENPAGAPPPYSTLPRPFEESLQIADGTTPTSRSRLASINNDLENH